MADRPLAFPALLRSKEPIFGTLITSPSPRWPDAVGKCGLDFVFLDTEHIALDRQQLSWMCQTYRRMNLPPLVRIPAPDPYAATVVLDAGAAGVVAPYVETVAQVQALRGAVKLRPLKGQRMEAILAGEPAEPRLKEYLGRTGKTKALVINIESIPAIENLDAILKVPDLDGILIGPHDLSVSLGIPEEYGHPRFRAAVRDIARRARAAGVGAGIHFWTDLALGREFLKAGINFMVHASDVQLFTEGIQREVGQLRGKRRKIAAAEAV